MYCRYTTVEFEGEIVKVFIPGCDAGAIHGEEYCTCDRTPRTFAAFERASYNQKMKEATELINQLQVENKRLERLTAKIFKKLNKATKKDKNKP